MKLPEGFNLTYIALACIAALALVAFLTAIKARADLARAIGEKAISQAKKGLDQ